MNRRWCHHYDGTSYCHYVQRCVNGAAAPSPSSRDPLPVAPDSSLTLPLPRAPFINSLHIQILLLPTCCRSNPLHRRNQSFPRPLIGWCSSEVTSDWLLAFRLFFGTAEEIPLWLVRGYSITLAIFGTPVFDVLLIGRKLQEICQGKLGFMLLCMNHSQCNGYYSILPKSICFAM